MSNYSSLKATINANIKANNNQEITGTILNSVLDEMVDVFGAGYQYIGKASPSTNPGTPDERVFYLASEPGTYTQFGNIVVGDAEVVVLKWATTWTKEVILADYATEDEIAELDSRLEAMEGEIEQMNARLFGGNVLVGRNISNDFIWVANKFIVGANPESDPNIHIGDYLSSSSSSSFANQQYVDISSYVKLRITLPHMSSATSAPGACFYNSSYQVVQGVWRANLSPNGMVEEVIDVPNGAKYIRTTWRSDYGDFSCFGLQYKQQGGLVGQLEGMDSSSETITDSFEFTQSKYRSQADGNLANSSSSSSYGSNLVDIQRFERLRVYVPMLNLEQTNAGWAWYDKDGAFIRGDALIGSALTMTEVELTIPKDAVYFATTKRTDGAVSTFACVGIRDSMDEYSKVVGKVEEQDIVNVRDYGAVGDGLIDDTIAVKAAIESGHSRIFFPAGTYLVGQTLLIPSKTEFYGEGIGKTILKFLGASNSVQPGGTRYNAYYWRTNQIFPMVHCHTGNSDISIHDLEIDGSDFTNSSRRYIGLSICGCTDVKVENVYIHHMNYDATRDASVQMEYAFQFFVWNNSSRVVISRCVGDYAGYENIGTEDVTDVIIKDSVWLSGWRTSVQIHRGSKRVKVTNCTINNSSTTAHASFTIHGVTTNPIEDLTVIGNNILSVTNENQGLRGGVALVQSGFKDFIFSGNTFDGNSYCIVDLLTDGESATWPSKVIITGNLLKNSRYGICLRRGNNYIIKDNIIDSANTAIDIKVTNYIVKDNILPNNTTKTLAGVPWTD